MAGNLDAAKLAVENKEMTVQQAIEKFNLDKQQAAELQKVSEKLQKAINPNGGDKPEDSFVGQTDLDIKAIQNYQEMHGSWAKAFSYSLGSAILGIFGLAATDVATKGKSTKLIEKSIGLLSKFGKFFVKNPAVAIAGLGIAGAYKILTSDSANADDKTNQASPYDEARNEAKTQLEQDLSKIIEQNPDITLEELKERFDLLNNERKYIIDGIFVADTNFKLQDLELGEGYEKIKAKFIEEKSNTIASSSEFKQIYYDYGISMPKEVEEKIHQKTRFCQDIIEMIIHEGSKFDKNEIEKELEAFNKYYDFKFTMADIQTTIKEESDIQELVKKNLDRLMSDFDIYSSNIQFNNFESFNDIENAIKSVCAERMSMSYNDILKDAQKDAIKENITVKEAIDYQVKHELDIINNHVNRKYTLQDLGIDA